MEWQWTDQGSPPGGLNLTGGVGVVTVQDSPGVPQRPYVFVVGNDGHLWVNWWDGATWQWKDQGIPPSHVAVGGILVDVDGSGPYETAGVITVQDSPGAPQRPYAFVMANDGHLWVNWWDGEAWHWADQGTPPSHTAIGGRLVGALSVENPSGTSQRPYAFIINDDQRLWVNWWTSTAWEWVDQGTPSGIGVNSPVGVLSVENPSGTPQRPYAFVMAGRDSADGHLWVNWWTSTAWEWADQGSPPGGLLLTVPSLGVGVLSVENPSGTPQRPYAFVIDKNGHLWVNWWDGATWQWANQEADQGPDNCAGNGVALTIQDSSGAPQRPYVFVASRDSQGLYNGVWVNWWDGVTWQWTNLGPPNNISFESFVGGVAVQDSNEGPQQPHVFVIDSKGNLWRVHPASSIM